MSDLPNHSDDNVVDLEEYFAAQKPVPKGKKYRIKIDKQQYVVEVPEMTGRDILALAGKTPEKFLLREKIGGIVEEIEPGQVVSFTAPGVERFMTIPKEVQEGEPALPRLHFDLLATDQEYLNSLGLRWEAVIEGGVKAIAMYQWPLPDGYNVSVVDVHVRLSDGYPDTQIDMAYFAPPLSRNDGRQINNLSTMTFDGKGWQQWSRHRTPNSLWRMGEDDLSTHMALVADWLKAELLK